MKGHFFLTLSLAILGLSCQNACQKKEDIQAKKSEQVLEKAAVVNDQAIDKAILDKLHNGAVDRMKRSNRPITDEVILRMRSNILSKLIDDELIKQQALKEGIKIDRIERVAFLEEYKKKIGGEKAYEAFIKHAGITEEELIENLNRDKLREKLSVKLGLIKVPTDKEIEEHFNNNKSLYRVPEMVHARHILFKLTPDDSKEKEQEVIKQANTVLQELKQPGSSFEEMAKKYSTCPSAKNGGDLGFFPRGRMVKSFEDVAFSGPLKTVQGPIKTDYGYHLLYVEEKTPLKDAELSEVKDKIIDFLNRNDRARGLEETLTSLRKKAKITILDQSLSLDQYLGKKENKKNENT